MRPHADRHDVYAWRCGAKAWLDARATSRRRPMRRAKWAQRRCDLPGGAVPGRAGRRAEGRGPLRPRDAPPVPRVRHRAVDPRAFGSDVHIPADVGGRAPLRAAAATGVGPDPRRAAAVAMSTCPRLRRSCPPAVLRGDGDAALAAAADELGRLAAAAADALLWRAGLPGRAATARGADERRPRLRGAPSPGTVLRSTVERGHGLLDDAGARLSRGRQDWAPAHFAFPSAVGPVLVALRELTAQATRDVRVTALRDVSMMARAAARRSTPGRALRWGGGPDVVYF